MKLKEILTETQEYDLFYKGYAVNFDQDSDGFFWLNYNPELPKELDHKYNKAANRTNAEIVAKRAIDELKKKVNESDENLSVLDDVVPDFYEHASAGSRNLNMIYKWIRANETLKKAFGEKLNDAKFVDFLRKQLGDKMVKYRNKLGHSSAVMGTVSESAPPKKAKVEFTDAKTWLGRAKAKGADVKTIIRKNNDGKRYEARLNGKLVGWFVEKTKMGILK